MSRQKDDDIWRKRYIRLLREPVSETTDSSQDDLQGIEDLVDEKLIRAHINHDIDGVVSGAAGLFVPTLKGRLFVEDQRAILRSKTVLGRLKSNFPLFSGLIGVILGWLLSSWNPFPAKQVSTAQRPDNAPSMQSQTQHVTGQTPTSTPSNITPIQNTSPGVDNDKQFD
jgi:hypothetical protein